MKIIAITAVLILLCEQASAQSNTPDKHALFQLPQVQLRLQRSNVESQPGINGEEFELPPTPVSASSTGQLSLNGSATDEERLWVRRLERGSYLTKPEPSANRFVRWTDTIFQPEPVRVGRISVSCSTVTAIKRKNPLCLISPRLLDVSW